MVHNIVLAAALAATASAEVYQGFNYGATFTSGAAKQYQDFKDEFTTAQNLVGHKGFSSARLYTNIQAGTTSDPISAFQAAMDTKTSMLLGIWGSSGQATVDSEIAALNKAIKQYGSAFTDLVAGISVGSEDLYRISSTGIMNKAGVGAGPDAVTSYLKQVRGNLTNSGVNFPIGHVDTWDAWTNGTNSAVIDNCDFLGVDEYPYFEPQHDNHVENGGNLFFQAFDKVKGVSGGKPVWVTESGWPVSGPNSGAAVANTQNAKRYWDDVACKILGETNTWWYTLQDAQPDTPSPSFGLVAGPQLSTQPLYDLSCSNTSSSGNTGSGSGSGSSGSKPSGSSSSSSSSPTSSNVASGSAGSSGSGSSGSGSSSSNGPASSNVASGSSGSPSSYGSGSTGSTGSTGSSGSPSSYGSGSTGSGSSNSGSSSSAGSYPASGSSAASASSSSSPYKSPYGSSNSSAPAVGAPGAAGPASYGSPASGSSGSGSSGSGSASSYSGSGSSSSSAYGSKTSPSAGRYTGAASINKPAAGLFAGAVVAALLA